MREKLIELIEQVYFCSIEHLADYLIANGVTVLDCGKDCKNCWKTQLVTPKWIPLSEKLPNTKGTYLVCTDKFGVVLAHWYGDRFGCGRASNRVTYWMPLPEPPREGDNDG